MVAIEYRSRAVAQALPTARSTVADDANQVLLSEAPIRAIVAEARTAHQEYVHSGRTRSS